MQTRDPRVLEIRELVSFLPYLYNDIQPILEWGGGKDETTGIIQMPWPKYDDRVAAFFKAVSRECWCDYDYVDKHAEKMLRDHDLIRCATMDQIKTMLTFCVRGERFCSGHWEAMITEGHIRRLLERLQVILHEQE